VLTFLQSYVRKHWHMLRHLQFKDPAFGFLMTLEKARRGGAGRRGEQGVEVVPPNEEERNANGRRRGETPHDAPQLPAPAAPHYEVPREEIVVPRLAAPRVRGRRPAPRRGRR
jgi:hypothetical protein